MSDSVSSDDSVNIPICSDDSDYSNTDDKENDIHDISELDIAFNAMKSGRSVFITGPGGVGKTHLIKRFIHWASTKFKIGITSSTGLSASLIGGQTIHSYTGIGLGSGTIDQLHKKVKTNRNCMFRWLSIRVLIIDEISMLDPELFDKLEELARLVRKNHRPFGGIQIIVSGDFCQLPPVKTKKFCFETKAWAKCIQDVFHLTKVWRQTDTKFIECLNEIRLGECKDYSLLEARVGAVLNNEYGIEPTILYSKRIDVDRINKERINALIRKDNVETHTFTSKINYPFERQLNEQTKGFLKQKIDRLCPIDDTLILCIGAQVILVINMPELDLVNGSRGVVVNFIDDKPVIQFSKTQTMFEPYTWTVSGDDIKHEITKSQLPVRLAYALTIHKSQGMSIDYVKTSIDSNIFECGQAYVVLSRCRSLEGLSFDEFDSRYIRTNPKVKEFYQNLNT